MKDMLSVDCADPTDDRLDWYRDRFGWQCRPHEECGPGCAGAGTDGARVDLLLGGARRVGALDLPALVGVAALERIGRRPAAAGPVLDGTGRLVFLVDLGEAGALDTGPVEFWCGAGIDLRLRTEGGLPLPAPGRSGPRAVVWAVPPDVDRVALPPAELLLGFLDRAVQDAYPALWAVVRRSAPSEY